MDIECRRCGAKLTGVSVPEAIKWDKTHDESCPKLNPKKAE